MKIVTEHVYPPIPDRSSDWSAIDDDTYDGPGSLIGWGATEDAAIADLEQQMDDADEAAEAARLAACEHCAGTGWISVRTTYPMAYVCAGSPPDYAEGVCEARCGECGRAGL